ncbi:hypothetical protein LJC60_06755 [Ruminococcaceae bacterium OttesenSCG-928-D13]|nr:hypothetical protein [Ruminococcaceae bacterium OttesenSCG-928-D13]
MDMLFNLSLYPINALAYTHDVTAAQKRKTDMQRMANERMAIPPVGQTKTATGKMANRSISYRPQKRFAPKARAFTGEAEAALHHAFPLSYMNVQARL